MERKYEDDSIYESWNKEYAAAKDALHLYSAEGQELWIESADDGKWEYDTVAVRFDSTEAVSFLYNWYNDFYLWRDVSFLNVKYGHVYAYLQNMQENNRHGRDGWVDATDLRERLKVWEAA